MIHLMQSDVGALKEAVMSNKKGMRFSIKAKILISSISMNLLICAVMGMAIYRYVYNSYVNTASEDTLAICKIAANQLNGNLLGLLEAGSDDSYANTVMKSDMQKVADSSNVYKIYTIGERNGSIVYLSQLAEGGKIGTAVDGGCADCISKALASDGYVSSSIIESDTGVNYITAYAPIQNNAGEVVGVLGIDYIADEVVNTLDSIIKTIGGIGAVLAVFSAIVSILVASGITRGLEKVDKKISDLVSNNGDLTQKIEVKGNDEVSDIAESINELLEYIRGVVGSIFDSSNKLSGSVDVALDNTVKTNDQLDGVSATMEQMSAAMEETSASLQQIQGSTTKIKDDVQEMYTSVKMGTDYANEMEQRAMQMRKHAEAETESARVAADDMTHNLNEKITKSQAVEGISGLTETILEIADQTNLLSLNASIEAARAGEHGKGFAVVAGEISTLATNSAETAKKIQIISQEVIDNVRELADEATKMVDFVREKTIGGYQQLMETGIQYQEDAQKIAEMLESVDRASMNIDKSMNIVSEAMDDVSTAVDESAKGIGDVAGAVSEMSGNMKENKTVANENANIAQQLDEEVNKFKF